MNYLITFITSFLLLLLSACATDWLGGEKEEVIPGERKQAFTREWSVLKVEDSKTKINLPAQTENNFFSESSQAGHNLKLSPSPKKHDKFSFAGFDDFIASPSPVAAENKIFLLDGDGYLHAIDSLELKPLWKTKVSEDSFLGGGISYSNGKVFATASDGAVVALNAANGSEIWRKKYRYSIKSSPAVNGDILLLKTTDSETYAVSAIDGSLLWNQAGLRNDVSFIGASNPIVSGEIAVITYSSGEVFSLNVKTGEVLWQDNIFASSQNSSLPISISDITATPVVADGNLYVGSSKNLFVAKKLSTGESLWEKEISTTRTAWVSGNVVFIVSVNDELIALNTSNGNIIWISQLKRYEDEEDKKGKITYSAPVVAGDKIYIATSNGRLHSFAPNSGQVLETTSIENSVFAKPIIANSTMFLFSNNGDLGVFK